MWPKVSLRAEMVPFDPYDGHLKGPKLYEKDNKFTHYTTQGVLSNLKKSEKNSYLPDSTLPPPYPIFIGNMYNNKKNLKKKKIHPKKESELGLDPSTTSELSSGFFFNLINPLTNSSF